MNFNLSSKIIRGSLQKFKKSFSTFSSESMDVLSFYYDKKYSSKSSSEDQDSTEKQSDIKKVEKTYSIVEIQDLSEQSKKKDISNKSCRWSAKTP